MSEFTTGQLCMYGGLIVAVLVLLLAGFTNLMSAFRYLSTEKDEPASPNSLIAWGLSALSFFLGPCGILTILIGFVLSRMEKRKVMEGEASAWTMIPCSAAGSNTLWYFVFLVLVSVSVVAGQLL